MSKTKSQLSPVKPKKAVFQIEKNIPIPPNKAGERGRPCKYPLDKMVVGDSFLVEKVHTRARANSLATSIRTATKNREMKAKFSVRKDVSVGAIRVWRVA